MVLTYPMIGNYGVPAKGENHGVSKRFESKKVHLRALIIWEECEAGLHWEAKESLAEFLKKHKIPAIRGIDTRALTQELREYGVMLGKIVEETKYFSGHEFSDPNAENLVAEVSVKEKIILEPKGKEVATVALIDCGIKHNIIRSFLDRGVRVIRLPWNQDLCETRNHYDGVFVTNGPGDPQMADKRIESLKWAMKENKVIFGICLGSQIMGLAAAGKPTGLSMATGALTNPAMDFINNKGERCYITSQNHGFAVDERVYRKAGRFGSTMRMTARWKAFGILLSLGSRSSFTPKPVPDLRTPVICSMNLSPK